jgi:hypothetical protein
LPYLHEHVFEIPSNIWIVTGGNKGIMREDTTAYNIRLVRDIGGDSRGRFCIPDSQILPTPAHDKGMIIRDGARKKPAVIGSGKVANKLADTRT